MFYTGQPEKIAMVQRYLLQLFQFTLNEKWQNMCLKCTKQTKNTKDRLQITHEELMVMIKEKVREDYQLKETLYKRLKKGQQEGRDWDEYIRDNKGTLRELGLSSEESDCNKCKEWFYSIYLEL